MKTRPVPRQRGKDLKVYFSSHIQLQLIRLSGARKKVHQAMSEGPAGRTPSARDLDPVEEAEDDIGTVPDCPSAEGSENMSVTNSEVESAMNHRRCRAILRDPEFSEEAFDAFSSADAYIRAARNGLSRATKQDLTYVRVSFLCPNRITMCQ